MENIIFQRGSDNNDYYYMNKNNKHPEAKDYYLHNHDFFEVLIFISGDADFIVEGTVYHLNPYDIIITRENEMHRIFHNSPAKYERSVLRIREDFFKKYECENYMSVFTDRKTGHKNIIPSEAVLNSEIIPVLHKLEKRIMENSDDIIVKCSIIEFLYLLNKLKDSGFAGTAPNKLVRSMVDYINQHLEEVLSLEMLSEKFFVSKYHLCRVFKEHTGFTVSKYITKKRIIRVQQLYKEGRTLNESAMIAGFGDYSNFYKSFVAETGISPRKLYKGTVD